MVCVIANRCSATKLFHPRYVKKFSLPVHSSRIVTMVKKVKGNAFRHVTSHFEANISP